MVNWKKKIAWALAGLAGLILVLVITGLLYLRSSAFQQFAMREIVKKTEQATGGRAQIGSFDFRLSTLTAHLYNFVLRGNSAADEAPLLHVDKLTVSLKIQSILRRKIMLSEVLIDHPVVNLRVDRDGKSNFPQPPPSRSSSKSSVNLFDLTIDHFAIANGEANFNDRKTPIVADLRDLKTDIDFESLQTQYTGSISYDEGRLQYGQHSPLSHSLSTKFTATPSLFKLDPAILKVASSTATLRVQARNYGDPTVTGDYHVQLHTPDFAAMSPMRANGDVSLTGGFKYHGRDDQPFLRNLDLQGRVGSTALSAASSAGAVDLRNLRGSYQLAGGSLEASEVSADILGGAVTAELHVQNLDKTPSSHVRASLRNISLPAVQQAMRSPQLNRVAIDSTLDGTAEAAWTGSIGNIRVHSDLSLKATPTTGKPSRTNVPVWGDIHADYDGERESLSLRQTTLQIPSAQLTANGRLSQASNLQIHAVSQQLGQLAAFISSFRSGSSPVPAVGGSATLNATLTGSTRSPRIAGQISAQNLQVADSRWKAADLSFEAAPSRITVSSASLQNARRGNIYFSANVGLQHWSYTPTNPIHASLSIQQMSVADLQNLANVRYPVNGEVSARLTFDGSQLDPRGSGSLDITKAEAYGEPLKNVALQVRGQNGTVSATLKVSADAGSAQSQFSYTPETRAYDFQLDAPSIVLQKLRAVEEKNLQVNGTLSASASGKGTLENPELSASVQVPTLNIHDKPISGIKADVHLVNKQANFSLNAQVVQAVVRGQGHVSLTDGYQTEASLDTGTVPLDPLLATYAGNVPDGFQGQTELHATLKGPLKDKTRLEAHVVIPILSASYQSLQIAATGPIRADYMHSAITLQPVEFRGTDTSLHMQGSYPLSGSVAPTLSAQGSIDMRIVRILAPDVKSSGTVVLDVHTGGSRGDPLVQGQIRLQKVALSTETAPLGVEKLDGTLQLDNNRLQISNMTGQVGGGQISAGGSITYRPSLDFNIALQGKSIRLRYPEGLRSVLDTNLTWVGTTQSSTLQGRVLIDSLSFTPNFDLASFGDQFSSNAAGLSQPGFTDTIRLQLMVQSNNNFNARSAQVSIEGNADLRVIGTAGNPVITGRADLTSGELFYRNVRYELQRGIITFDDPTQTRPVLNVSVTTTIEQYDLTLNLRGAFDRLTTAYVSDPPLAASDIINLIARGKTGAESAASSQSTDSMIVSQAAGQISGGVQKLVGISSLQIDPLLGSNGQNPSARLAIQQRVTKNFLFTFSTDVSEPGSETVQGDYQINKHWSVSVTRNQLGGVSIDGRFHTRF